MTKRKSRTTTEPLLAGSILKQQMDLESQAVRNGVIRYRKLVQETIDRGDGAALKPAERLLLHWLRVMREAVREERRAIRRGVPSKGRQIYGPALLILDADRAAVVTTHEMLGHTMAEPHGAPVRAVAYSIGRACLAELNHDLLRSTKDKRKIWKELTKHIRRILPQHVNWWAKKNLDDPIWSKRVAIHMGTALMWLLIGVASTRDYDAEGAFHPAFRHVGGGTSARTGKKSVVLDPETSALIEEGHEIRQYLRPVYLPMVVQPYPWSAERDGGYLRLPTPLVNRSQPRNRAALKSADLTQIHDGLNAVNAAPWRINKKVQAVVKAIWDSGGNDLDIPRADDEQKPPFRPDDIEKWKEEAREVHERNKHLKADRQLFIQRLMIADQMPDRFYLPHFLDFRGRCYPVPPHLSHHGDDLCRGLLEWSAGKPVDSLYWPAIQAANCWEQGIDKLPFDDKLEWVEQNSEGVWASADKPLDCHWWRKAKKPWQFLAACFAMVDKGSCHLPIRTDGTCNGLQHYAALGRSAEDARVVNMLPGDVPIDAYTIVADRVRPMVGTDADAGHPWAQVVASLISRDVVKQTVMTKMYDVTPVGARKQIYGQLEKLGVEGDDLYKCSFYLSRIVMKAVGYVCHSTAEIMEWLRTCAQKAVATGEPVQWTTPLGFPVVQPYRNYRTKTIHTVLQAVSTYMDNDDVPISISKQCKGFAPNYIHSLDASHMLMTARVCHETEIAFAAVHDAYYSHAADMDRMGRILRREFIRLHEPPLMEQLLAELRQRYADIEFPDPPDRGDYDLNQVMESRYFFS